MKKYSSYLGIAVAVLIVLLSVFIGAGFGKGFSKYSMVRISSTTEFDAAKIKEEISGLGLGRLEVVTGKENFNQQILISANRISDADAQKILEICKKGNSDAYLRSHDEVTNLEKGKKILKYSLMLLIAAVLSAAFLAYRLGIKAGIAGLIALVCAVVLSLSICSLAGIGITDMMMTANSLLAMVTAMILFYVVAGRMDLKGANRASGESVGVLFKEAAKKSLTKVVPLLFAIVAINVASIFASGIGTQLMSICFSCIASIYSVYLIALPIYLKINE